MGINQNSWKSIQFDLTAATVKRLDLEKVFSDNNFVRPNFIQIKNLNTSDILYVGDTKTVGSTEYRLTINPLSTGKSINIDGFSDLYFLIASNTTKLELNYAYDDAPSASDLDGTQDITIINQNLTVANVGISSIAAGNNNIGNVDIASAIPAGDNNIGNVDLASAIPAGTNLIGKINVSQGGNDLVVEADGSINVNGATFNGTIGTVKLEDSSGTYFLNIDSSGYITSKLSGAIPAGDNNIGNVDIASAIPAGDNNIGNVDLASAIPAGDNNIGNVDIVTVASGQNLKPSTSPVIYNVTCVDADTEYSQALPSGCKKFSIGLKSKNSNIIWVLKFGTGGTEFSLTGDETVTEDNILCSSQTLYFESDTAGEIIQIMAWS